jgi:hypothetical protein
MICTRLNLHYVRKLSRKSELFWLSGAREEFFSMTNIFVIIFPLTRTWPFIWTIFNSFHPRMNCTQYCWNWSAALDIFFNVNKCKYGFPIVVPPDPRGPWFEQTWISTVIISERFHVNLNSFGSVVLRRFLNHLTSFLHLPFEEDLALY